MDNINPNWSGEYKAHMAGESGPECACGCAIAIKDAREGETRCPACAAMREAAGDIAWIFSPKKDEATVDQIFKILDAKLGEALCEQLNGRLAGAGNEARIYKKQMQEAPAASTTPSAPSLAASAAT